MIGTRNQHITLVGSELRRPLRDARAPRLRGRRPRADVPNLRGRIVRRGHDSITVGTERRGFQWPQMPHRLGDGSAGRVPEPCGTIARRRQNPRSVRTEDGTHDGAAVLHRRAELIARCGVPDRRGAILGRGDDEQSIRTKLREEHTAVVLKRGVRRERRRRASGAILASAAGGLRHLPEPRGSVVVRRDEVRAVGRKVGGQDDRDLRLETCRHERREFPNRRVATARREQTAAVVAELHD